MNSVRDKIGQGYISKLTSKNEVGNLQYVSGEWKSFQIQHAKGSETGTACEIDQSPHVYSVRDIFQVKARLKSKLAGFRHILDSPRSNLQLMMHVVHLQPDEVFVYFYIFLLTFQWILSAFD